MKYKVGDEVYINTKIMHTDSRGYVVGYIPNFIAEEDVIPLPIAKIKERIANTKTHKDSGDAVESEGWLLGYVNGLKYVLSLLEGKE